MRNRKKNFLTNVSIALFSFIERRLSENNEVSGKLLCLKANAIENFTFTKKQNRTD